MTESTTRIMGEKILITGPTSQVATPIAEALAQDNDVYGLARFSKAEDREKVEAQGLTPIPVDLATSGRRRYKLGLRAIRR